MEASPQKFKKNESKVSQQRSGLLRARFTAKVSQNEFHSFSAKVWSCNCTLHRKSFTKRIAKFPSKGPVLSVDALFQNFHKMNLVVSQRRSGLIIGGFLAKVSQYELKSFAAKVRSCQWMLHRKKIHKMNCKVSQQMSGLVTGRFTAKVSQNELESFSAKVWSCNCTLHRKSFTKELQSFAATFRSYQWTLHRKTFQKMNCKVSQQRSGLLSGPFTAKVSQNQLQSFAANVRSCQWMLHRKRFTK